MLPLLSPESLRSLAVCALKDQKTGPISLAFLFQTYSRQSGLQRNVSSHRWSLNSLISGYIDFGRPECGLILYDKFKDDPSLLINAHTFTSLLKSCLNFDNLETLLSIHSEIVRLGFLETDVFISSSLINLYGHYGLLDKSVEVFEKLQLKSTVSWNSLIVAYTRNGYAELGIKCLDHMKLCHIVPDDITYICTLKACGETRDIETGMQLHSEIESIGLSEQYKIARALVDTYAKCGMLTVAQHLLEKLTVCDVISWSALMEEYIKHGLDEEALECLAMMQSHNVSPNLVTLVCSLKACSHTCNIDKGKDMHVEIVKKGFEAYPIALNCLINMYSKCGWLSEAEYLFDILPDRDIVSWTTLITGYTDHLQSVEAINLFEHMQLQGISPNEVTFVCVLKACGIIMDKNKGQEIHADVERKTLPETNVFVGSVLVHMYSNLGDLAKAREVFDRLPVKNLVTWNILFSGYSEHGLDIEALECFENMQDKHIVPDKMTYIHSLKNCSDTGNMEKGCEIHSDIECRGLLGTDVVIGNAMLDMYARNGWVVEAQHLFNLLRVKDTVAWTNLIFGYVEHGDTGNALKYIQQMQHERIPPDAITFTCVLKVYADTRDIENGRAIHMEIEKKGFFQQDNLVGHSLVDMYIRCGLLYEAQKVFNKLPVQDTSAWTTLIVGYTEYGHCKEALNCLKQMQLEGVSPDVVTYLCVLKACASIGLISEGLEIHSSINSKGWLEIDPSMCNSLLNMYCKCTSVSNVQNIFDKLPHHDTITWNSLIVGYGIHEYDESALQCLDQMQLAGLSPDVITYVLLLKVCTYIGALGKGQEMHSEIIMKGLLDKYIILNNVMVDMYAKYGLLAAAEQMLEKYQNCDRITWNSLIGGYAQVGESKNVFNIFNKMAEMGIKPDAITFTILLNTCSRSCLFDNSHSYFQAMTKKHGVSPELHHYTCVVDLFGRAGYLHKSIEIISRMPFNANFVVWNTLLSVCRGCANVNIARQAFEHTLSFSLLSGCS